jgi:HAD superfamily hydrolase (TIGR01549 family)
VIGAVFFDVGSTILDETRMFREWADRLLVSEEQLLGALNEAIRCREHHHRVFERLGRGREAAEVSASLGPVMYQAADLYPDVVDCLVRLRQDGYLLGLAGNQPAEANALLVSLGLDVDVVATSAEWGVEKPSHRFFSRLAAAAEKPTPEIAYVGDRVDNDIVPAAEAGMVAVFLRRGPWAAVHDGWPESQRARLCIDSLAELPEALRSLG